MGSRNGRAGFGRYGRFSRNGSGWNGDQEMIGAHRMAFLLTHGHLPTVVRHTCDNPGCVNPAHLQGGTYADNARDMVERNRQARGERQGSARLNENIVQWVRASQLPRRTIAEWAGVSVSLVEKIRARKRWKHV